MKKIGLLSLLVLLTFSLAQADIPKIIHFQGRLTDLSGVPISEGGHGITFNLWDAETGGNLLWTGNYTVSTKSGYYSIDLGDSPSPFPAAMTFDQPYYLDLQVGGDPDVLSPRIKLDSAAYAMNVADNAIVTTKLKDGAVTEAKLADSAVTTAKLDDSAVTNAKLAYHAITADKMENSAVITDKIADNAVTTTKVADSAVTNAKLAAGAVTGSKITDGSVTATKIANGAVNSQAKAPYAPEVYFNGTRTPNIKILTGSSGTNASGYEKVNFPTNFFSTPPRVFFTASNNTYLVAMDLQSVTKDYFEVWSRYMNSQAFPTSYQWMAIGY